MLRQSATRADGPGADADPSAFDWAEDAEWGTIEIVTGKELLRAPYAASPLVEKVP